MRVYIYMCVRIYMSVYLYTYVRMRSIYSRYFGLCGRLS